MSITFYQREYLISINIFAALNLSTQLVQYRTVGHELEFKYFNKTSTLPK